MTARAEDWMTTDGKKYKDVTVVKVDPDAVTILDSDGGARVPLSVLPPELQKKFKYDPAKAAAAAKQHDADEALAAKSLAEAKKQEEEQRQKNDQRETEATAKALADYQSEQNKLAQAHASTAAKSYRLLSSIMRTAVADDFRLARLGGEHRGEPSQGRSRS